MHVGIVGAGFGGCATALALARAGHRVTLLEAVESPQPVGAGIMLLRRSLPIAQPVLALGAGASAAKGRDAADCVPDQE